MTLLADLPPLTFIPQQDAMESLSTLRIADSAKQIKNTVSRVTDIKAAHPYENKLKKAMFHQNLERL